MTQPLPEAAPRKAARPEIGATFEPRFFNGKYTLYDDGRRSGTLVLKVLDGGAVTGAYYSGKDGKKYEVSGKVGNPPHAIQFTVTFPRTTQTFQGWLFKKTTAYERVMLLVAGVLLVYPKTLFDAVGFVLVAIVLVTQFKVKRLEPARARAR